MKCRLSIIFVCVAILAGSVPLHAAALSAGDVFAFGFNGNGKTGLGETNGITPVATAIDTSNLGGRAIKQAVAAGFHSLLLAEDGTVFSFGANFHGRTGLGTADDNTLVATAIDTSNLGGRAITQVSARYIHSLLLAEDGTVFSFGRNSGGRTGLGTADGLTTVATPIDTSNLGGKTITQLSAGGNHSLLLADDGTVFSFGFNSNGATGLGVADGFTPVATAIDTSNLGGRAIMQVAAGDSHSLILAEDGTVFAFGYNSNGRTGLGTDSGFTPVATAIDTRNLGGRAIKQISADGNLSLLLAEDGTVFAFGNNSVGATGLGTTIGFTPVATAIDATNLGGRAIRQVAAGFFYSMLLAEDGTAFSFGDHNFDQLLLGKDINPVATPIDTSNLGDLVITQVSVGGAHQLLIAVPEPGTLVLAGLALPVLAVRHPRQRD